MAPQTLRRETDQLVRLAGRDLNALWRLVSQGAAAETALRDLLPAIVSSYGSAGAALAAEWYDDQRAKTDARGRFTAIPVEPGDRGTQSLIGWALASASDDTTLKTLILGGVQRRVADHVRHTIMDSSAADQAARGWQRVGAGACKNGFCDMLIARGAVYTEATADFAAHDHCQCSAVPAFKGDPKPVRGFTPSSRNITDADRANLRSYLASH